MTMRRIMRGLNPAVYRQDWIATNAITELAAGTETVDFTVADASLFPRGTGSGEPGECVIMSDTDSQAGSEVLYDWTSVSGNTLIGCSRRYGSSTSAGAVVNISFTGGMYEAFRTEIDAKIPTSYIDTDGTLSANSDSKISSQKAGKTYIDAHKNNTSNPHSVTKSQVGLGNVTDVAQMPASYLDTDTTLAANSDIRVTSQAAIKAYVDTLWSARYNILTTSAQVAAFLASDTAYHAMVAPGNYTIGSVSGNWLMRKGNKWLEFLPGVNITIESGYAWTTAPVADTDYKYGALSVTFNAACSIATVTGGVDWSVFSALPGARLWYRGIAFSVASSNATTITVPTAERGAFDIPLTPVGKGILFIPICTGLKMTGEISLVLATGHTGTAINWGGITDYDFGGLTVKLSGNPTALETNPIRMNYHANGVLPNFQVNHQTITWKAGTEPGALICFALGQNISWPRSAFNHFRSEYNYNASGTDVVIAALSAGYNVTIGGNGFYMGNYSVYNNYAGKNSDGYNLYLEDGNRYMIRMTYNLPFAAGAGGPGSVGNIIGAPTNSSTVTAP